LPRLSPNLARHVDGDGRQRRQLPAAAHMQELFELALTKAMNGTWQMGTSYSGAWSIRAYPRD